MFHKFNSPPGHNHSSLMSPNPYKITAKYNPKLNKISAKYSHSNIPLNQNKLKKK